VSAAEIIHPVALDDVGPWVRTMATTFLQDPAGEDAEHWIEQTASRWDGARTWGARADGRWVATLRTEPRTITVPGHDGATEVIAADALTNVTVAATHRRQRVLSRMLDGSLGEARERGEPVSILVAAEYPIYGRFGYAPVALRATHALHPRRPGGRVAGDPSRVRPVDLEEFGRLAPEVFAQVRGRRAGQVDRDPPWWERTLGLGGWTARPGVAAPHNRLVHEGEAGPDGLLTWTAVGEARFLPPFPSVTADLLAGSDLAERDLWAYLTGLDLVDEIVVSARPLDEPVRRLLPDARTMISSEISDELWLRLLDVPAALSARRYAADGDLVLEVLDDTPVSVAGRYRLVADATAGTASCEPSRAQPDLTVTQPALAAAYLGGGPLRGRIATGEVVGHRPGAVTHADAMFLTALDPWNCTPF
jgi:predicted acetyltransferase